MILNSDLILQFTEYDFQKSHRRDELDSTWIRLDEVNKLLRDEMSNWELQEFWISDKTVYEGMATNFSKTSSIQVRSRIMPPQPIRTETAEDVLRDFVKWVDKGGTPLPEIVEVATRARKVLKK